MQPDANDIITITNNLTAEYFVVILVRQDKTTPIQIGNLKACAKGRLFL